MNKDVHGSLLDLAGRRLARLTRALGIDGRAQGIYDDVAFVLGSDAATPRAVPFASDVCDDHTPFEFSVSVDARGHQLRVLAETVGAEPTLGSTDAACVAMTQQLARRLRLHLGRLHDVEDLFTSASPAGSFTRWHALEYYPDGRVAVKIYLNPQLGGPQQAREVIEAALHRVGRADAWKHFESRATRGEADEVKYFSLDLDARPNSRVKVYVRHHDLTCEELEAYLDGSRGHLPGSAAYFCRAMLGDRARFDRKPVFSCMSWVDGVEDPKTTTYAPVAGYVRDDADARARVVAFMRARGLDAQVYGNALAAFAERPLESGVGMQSYVSLRWDDGAPRITAYLSPEAYRVTPPRIELANTMAGSVSP